MNGKDRVINGEISPMLTVKEAACLLNAHINTVRRWSDRGILPAYHIGPRGDRRFYRYDIMRASAELKDHRGNPLELNISQGQYAASNDAVLSFAGKQTSK